VWWSNAGRSWQARKPPWKVTDARSKRWRRSGPGRLHDRGTCAAALGERGYRGSRSAFGRGPILNHTKAGELIYDPFLGSGTTLAAAEVTKRVCYGLELDPQYADVVVERWQGLSENDVC